jgi:Transglycosylase-like domain
VIARGPPNGGGTPTHTEVNPKVRSRTAVAFIATLFLVAVPAAFATSQGVLPAISAPKLVKQSPELVQPSALDRPAVKAEVSRDASAVVRRLAEHKRRAALPKVSVPPQMAAIAQCESHGNPRSIGGGGLYRGKYQMTTSIWASVGGKGDPAAAPEAEQDRRAALLYQRSGPGQWPVCGQ